jgi:hypothetical protein
VNAKQFGVAVVPIVLAEIVLTVAHQLLAGESESSWADWVLLGVSGVLFPSWAGARVARFDRSWLHLCAGGVSVLAGTIVALAILEYFEPSLAHFSLGYIIGSILVLVPVYALIGFLGGWLALRSEAYGA